MIARSLVRLIALALLVVLTQVAPNAQYTVQANDTLWALAGQNLDSAAVWEQIVEANPKLKEPGRRFEREGVIVVVLHPGETLEGLDKLGIVPTPVPTSVVGYPAGCTSASGYSSTTGGPCGAPTPDKVMLVKADVAQPVTGTPMWLWWLLGTMVLVLAGAWLYTRNPTRWRPVVTGGVQQDIVALSMLETQAAGRGASVIPGSQERIRLFGVWGTQHRGIPIPIPHRYDGERAWRARFRMPNGTERSGLMLQGCGNDVVYGGAWYVPFRGARIEEGWGFPATTQVPVATPSTEAEVVQVPAIAPVAEQHEIGVVKLEVRAATANDGAMVRMTGVNEAADHTCEFRPGVIVLRFTPRTA